MKILLGGIPLGCDNIGDEAIIACVVKMLKESIPGVELAVATADPATASLLGVEVLPPYGFAGVGMDDFAKVVSKFDAYIWCGATGLSDYPDTALDLLEAAQSKGVATYIWAVGMDSELNPVFFKVHGRRRAILKALGLVGWYEKHLASKLKRRIAKILPRCKGVWVRDPESAAMLASMGFANAKVAADSVILMACDEPPPAQNRKLGLCISTQRQVANLDGLARLIDAVRKSGAEVVGIPMNPKTDSILLEKLGVECITGTTPEAVMAAAAQCSAVLSSRLHLLILAANAGTPILGIARGSKLQNFLSNFNRTVEGSVYDCDWPQTTRHVLSALSARGDWDSIRNAAYSKLRARFETARKELIDKLPDCFKA